MRDYLRLSAKKRKQYRYNVHSLVPQNTATAFPVKRCLCIIGSDYSSYGIMKEAARNFSDGLVKQDRAYVVGGEKPTNGDEYPEDQKFSGLISTGHIPAVENRQ